MGVLKKFPAKYCCHLIDKQQFTDLVRNTYSEMYDIWNLKL
jgi:hypothetical protein